MRRVLLTIGVLLWAITVQAQALGPAQVINVQDSGTSCSNAGTCATFAVNTSVSLSFGITGTFSGTLSFQCSTDGSTFTALLVSNVASGSQGTTTTSTGNFSSNNPGCQQVRVVGTTINSGAATVGATRGYGSAARLAPSFSGGCATGALLYANVSLGCLSDVATGQVLASGGVGAAPAYTPTPTVTSVTGSSDLTLAAATNSQLTLGANTTTGVATLNTRLNIAGGTIPYTDYLFTITAWNGTASGATKDAGIGLTTAAGQGASFMDMKNEIGTSRIGRVNSAGSGGLFGGAGGGAVANALQLGSRDAGSPVQIFTHDINRIYIDTNGNVAVGRITAGGQLFTVGSSDQFSVDTSGNTRAATLTQTTGTEPVAVSCPGCTTTNFGTPNGIYAVAGTFNGKNYYQRGSDSWYVWWASAGGGFWFVTPALGTQTPEWFQSSTATVPPYTNTWTAANGGATGTLTSSQGVATTSVFASSGNLTTGNNLTVQGCGFTMLGTNSQSFGLNCLTELTTIAAAASTDTAIQMPAGAIVMAVNTYVQTAIPIPQTIVVTCPGCTSSSGNPAGTFTYAGTFTGKNLYDNGAGWQLWWASNFWKVTPLAGTSTPEWFISSTATLPPASASWTGANSASGTLTTSLNAFTTFTVGDSGSAARFSTAAVSVVAGSSDAGTKAGAYYNAGALAIRITPGSTPIDTTGRVRTTIYYWLSTPPVS